MIEMIEKKNRDLKKREAEITVKEQRLRTLEENILKDLKKIEDAIARSEQQIGIQKNLIKENVAGLVKAYSAMKPLEAAKLLEVINEDLAIQILSGMKSKVAGQVLSKLNVKVAKNISEKLAGKRKIPDVK
jgi:flagellar motility protein MotE (MotC chaperone)